MGCSSLHPYRQDFKKSKDENRRANRDTLELWVGH
jgi:hypothetical protein